MSRFLLGAVALVSLSAAWQAKADTINPVVEYSSAATLTDSRPFTLGYEFTTSVSFDVNALGYWDDGLGHSHQVGIWTSGGTLLTSTTVTGIDSLVGHFRYQTIADLILAPGTYVIGGQFLGNNDPFPFDASGIVTKPGYTYVTDEQVFGAGLNFPTLTTNGTYGSNGILAVDFSTSAAVPEPSAVLLLGTVLAMAGLTLRKRAVKA